MQVKKMPFLRFCFPVPKRFARRHFRQMSELFSKKHSEKRVVVLMLTDNVSLRSDPLISVEVSAPSFIDCREIMTPIMRYVEMLEYSLTKIELKHWDSFAIRKTLHGDFLICRNGMKALTYNEISKKLTGSP